MYKKDIKLVDLSQQYKSIKKEILSGLKNLIQSTNFIQGRYTDRLEKQMAALHHTKYAIGCSNGTAAISLALETLDIQRGDEVITTPFTFIATIEAIFHVGATPVFVDIDPKTYTLDPGKIENRITKKTSAIIPVHIFGNPAKMDEIMKIAKKHNLKVIEDCAQAHLATYKNKFVGSFGDAATFSFYPSKNLGAYGDAGAIITNSDKTAQKVRLLINHGRKDKYTHLIIGYNQRIDEIQAFILCTKMKYLEEWTDKRRKNAVIYNNCLKNNQKIIIPSNQNDSRHVYHLYAIQIHNRDDIKKHLDKKGIMTVVHYPIPLHLQPALRSLNYKKGDFPIAERVSKRILSLPLYPELKKQEIEYVCAILNKLSKKDKTRYV